MPDAAFITSCAATPPKKAHLMGRGEEGSERSGGSREGWKKRGFGGIVQRVKEWGIFDGEGGESVGEVVS